MGSPFALQLTLTDSGNPEYCIIGPGGLCLAQTQIELVGRFIVDYHNSLFNLYQSRLGRRTAVGMVAVECEKDMQVSIVTQQGQCVRGPSGEAVGLFADSEYAQLMCDLLNLCIEMRKRSLVLRSILLADSMLIDRTDILESISFLRFDGSIRLGSTSYVGRGVDGEDILWTRNPNLLLSLPWLRPKIVSLAEERRDTAICSSGYLTSRTSRKPRRTRYRFSIAKVRDEEGIAFDIQGHGGCVFFRTIKEDVAEYLSRLLNVPLILDEELASSSEARYIVDEYGANQEIERTSCSGVVVIDRGGVQIGVIKDMALWKDIAETTKLGVENMFAESLLREVMRVDPAIRGNIHETRRVFEGVVILSSQKGDECRHALVNQQGETILFSSDLDSILGIDSGVRTLCRFADET